MTSDKRMETKRAISEVAIICVSHILQMPMCFQDWLASTCQSFLEVLCVRRHRNGTEPRAVYYLRSLGGCLVKVGESMSRSTHHLLYVADVSFVKQYSVLFELGDQFVWRKYADFLAWLDSIVVARPKFIQPFYRSTNALATLPTLPKKTDYCPCWFVDIVQITTNMKVVIPKTFLPYIFAPPSGVAIVHSSARYFYVKLENGELTIGWNHVALAHNFGRNYILMFGLVGYLQFYLFMFDEECEVRYDWSITWPIHQVDAPIGWDAEVAMCSANRSVGLTACPPASFRAFRHPLRCNLLLRSFDLHRLEMPILFQQFCKVHSTKYFCLVSKG